MHRFGPLALAALVAVVLTGGLATQVPASACSNLSITVVSSEEKAKLLGQMAGEFNAIHRNECLSVQVVRKASGATEQALVAGWNPKTDDQRPDVWSPAASTWIELANQELAVRKRPPIAPGNNPSLFLSPLVIGMPQPMAQAIEASGRPVGWADLLQLAGDKSGWSRYGHPEYGAFQLAKTDPLISTSGLHALIGTYFAASGGPSSSLTTATLGEPAVTGFVSGVERSVAHYGDSVSNFLLALQAADDAGRALSYVSAIAMEEKEIWDYNQGIPTGDPASLGKHALPKVPLVAIYPKEGTLAADHPYAILTAPWVTADKRRAAQLFLQYLEDAPAQARFLAAGFRNQSGPGPVIIPANGMRPDLPGAYLRLPPPSVIQAIQASWTGLRKRARVVLVVDRSALSSGLDAHKLAQSVSAGLKQQLSGDDQVGLWVFPGVSGGSLPYSELVSVQPLQVDAATLESSIGALKPSTSKIALYSSLGAAVAAMGNSVDPARVNGVVLISAGHTTDEGDSARFPTLTAVNGIAGRVPGVHVFTIAVGKSPDRANLHQIALEGDGASYDASDPTSISRALAALISNF